MDPRERLRMALLGAGCSRCGRTYPADGIRVLAQREAIAFVQLECPSCETQTLALVTGIPADEDAAGAAEAWPESGHAEPLTRGTAGAAEQRRPGSDGEAPISTSDVDEMRTFLAGYHGDLRSLVSQRRRDGGAGTR